MLDETLNFPKEEKKSYPPIPKGLYQAELLEVSSEVVETYNSKKNNKNPKEFETKIIYQFTILNGGTQDGPLRGRNIWNNFGRSTLYIGKTGKNDLYQIVEAFLGRELTQEEEARGISARLLNSFVGKQILLLIEPKTKDGNTYDTITNYLTANGQLQPLTAEEKENAKVKKKDTANGQATHSAGVPLTPADYMRSEMESVQDNEPTMDDMIKNMPF
jgi:hypothetical protein